MRYIRTAISLIYEDATQLMQTKTAIGAMVLLGWIVLAAMTPPIELISAKREEESATAILSLAPESSVPSSMAARMVPASSRQKLEAATMPLNLPRQPWNQRGVFLTPSSTGSDEFRTRTLNRLREVGGNAIIFDAKGSAVHFDAQNAPIAESLGLIKPWYNIEEVVPLLHERGVYAIARFIAIKDYGITEKLPETQLSHPDTGHILTKNWIDPEDPMALEYNREIICELARSGVDEINLDYIRYNTQIPLDPRAFPPEEKIERIETFIKMARSAIDECGPNTKLGVSTFAILGWGYEKNVAAIGQDVVRFAPMLDVISPMAYNANFSINAYGDPTGERGRWNYLVYRTLTGYAEVLGPDHAWKLRPWIQGFGVSSWDVQQQMQGVFDSGACGFLVWNANNGYAPFYDAMKKIEVPEHCKGGNL
jgi:hypothetical protein